MQDFFRFLRRFVRVWLQSLQKGSRQPQKIQYGYRKNAEFDADIKSIEKVEKSQKAYLKKFRGQGTFEHSTQG